MAERMTTAEYLKITAGGGGKKAGGGVEKDIQDSILDYLGMTRVLAWRNNTGVGRFQGKDGKDRFIRFSRPGASDIFAVKNGTFIAIEVKRPGGKVSPAQAEFIEDVTKAGGIAFVAYSLEDVIEKLSNL